MVFHTYIDDANAGCVIPEPYDQEAMNKVVASALSDDAQRKVWSENGVQFGRDTKALYDMPGQAVSIVQRFMSQSGRSVE